MKKHLLYLLVIALLSSCSQYDEPVAMIAPEQNHPLNIHTIPVDSAVAFLNAFLESDVQSRGEEQRTVSSVQTLKYSLVSSRSDTTDCENLLYVANFAGNKGYAFLAGDDRIPTRVIAVTDTGTLSDRKLADITNKYFSNQRPIVEGYPLTGKGFFTVEEYGDELFINPNTVDMYIESEQDTLVGNYTLDEEDRDKIIGKVEFEYNDDTGSELPYIRVIDFAIDEVGNNSGNHFGSVDEEYKGIGVSGAEPGKQDITTEITELAYEPNQLTKFTGWHQKSPFNDLYPKRRKYLICGPSRKAYAGCFPLALAKIITHLEHPNTYTYNGVNINYASLRTNFMSEKGKVYAAHLLKAISDACGSWMFYEGTFTFPHKVADYMQFLGFKNVKSYEFTFKRVTDMLDMGYPVIISSIPKNYAVWNSHAWNIDGYKVKKVTTTQKWWKNGSVIHTEVKETTYDMVHCDFGWGGNYNGYYVAGVFKLNDLNAEIDSTKGDSNTHYKHNTKVILYNL